VVRTADPFRVIRADAATAHPELEIGVAPAGYHTTVDRVESAHLGESVIWIAVPVTSQVYEAAVDLTGMRTVISAGRADTHRWRNSGPTTAIARTADT
jgi:hypothetical protein